jgi:hypothetical protein
VLVSELLSRGAMTIVVMIGSTSSKIETENTLKTLKSYEVISRKRDMPVIAAYRENSVDRPRGYVDNEIQTLIILLAAIFSGQNRELDMSDLRNFINYNKVTSYGPKLSLLDFFSQNIVLTKGQSLVSAVSLVDTTTSHEIDIPTEYQATGFIPDGAKEAVSVSLPIHCCVIAGYFNSVVDKLNAKLTMYAENRKAVIEKSIAHDHHDSTEDGLVL